MPGLDPGIHRDKSGGPKGSPFFFRCVNNAKWYHSGFLRWFKISFRSSTNERGRDAAATLTFLLTAKRSLR